MTTALAPARHSNEAFPVTHMGANVLNVTNAHGPARGHRYTLAAPTAPADVRALVRKHAPAPVADIAELAASELVTNALLHADGASRVTMTVTASMLILTVTDRRSDKPIPRPDPAVAFDLDTVSGRGLAMILAFGAELMVRRELARNRKRVTVRLPVDGGAR